MGMYDYINGEQIKCFYEIIYSTRTFGGNLWQSGGNMISFKTGDDVPYKSLYYNYGRDFIIFDEHECIAHYIKNGKIIETINPHNIESTLKDVDFNKFIVINYFGERLKISSSKDLIVFYKEFKKKNEDISNIYKRSSEKLQEWTKSSHKITALSKDSFIGNKERFFEDFIKEDFAFKGKDKNSYKCLSDIHNDNEVISILKEHYKKEYDSLEKEYDEIHSLEEISGETYLNKFNEKWFYYHNSKFNDYQYFGSLLGAYNLLSMFSYKERAEDVAKCKAEIKNYLDNSLIDLDEYFKLFDVDLEGRECLLKELSVIKK